VTNVIVDVLKKTEPVEARSVVVIFRETNPESYYVAGKPIK